MSAEKPSWRRLRPWGRHGMILVTAGLIYILIGVAYFAMYTPASSGQNLFLAEYIMPFEFWYAGFILVGIFSIVSSRWPSTTRPLGYSALTGSTVAWACFHFVGGLMEPVNATYIVSGLVLAMLAFLWWAISGLIGPPSERRSRGHSACGGHSDRHDLGAIGDRDSEDSF